MPTSQYIPFATGVGANTLSPTTYAANPLIALGHQPGVALSEVVNTTLRQTSVAATGLALLATTFGTLDMPDDGNPATYSAGVKNALDAIIASRQFWLPGDVKSTLVNSVPAGWLKANGAVVLRASYPALFAAIGTTYNGVGVASDSFQLPDLRGDFLRGFDDGRGVDVGRVLGSEQTDATQRTVGYFGVDDRNNGTGVGAFVGGSTSAALAAGAPAVDTTASGGGEGTFYMQFDNARVARTAAETRPRNVAVVWLIRAI